MLHFAVGALLAFAFAMILDLHPAAATMISTDLYLSRFCGGCTSLMDDTINPDLDWLISTETTMHDFTVCKYYEALYCKHFGDGLSAWAETEIIKSINAQRGSDISDLEADRK